MKADAKTFKGIEFVLLSELPKNQQEKISESVNPNLFIKLLIDGKILGPCMQYKDYCLWFDTEFKQRAVPVTEKATLEIKINPNLALNKL